MSGDRVSLALEGGFTLPDFKQKTARFYAIRGLPFSTYAPKGGGGGGVKPPIHFHYVLHAKRGWVGPDSM